MENQKSIENTVAFLETVVIGELGKVQNAGLSYMQFVLMGQAIEVLGGFLDRKPMKTKGQAAKRFAAGITYLFGGKYRILNENDFLYHKLRNQMVHAFIPAQDILLLNQEEESGEFRHLERKNGQLVMISGVFYRDICRACKRLADLIKEGKVKPKNIAFGDDE